MDWTRIKAAVEKNGNVKTFTMGMLRDARGVSRLGAHIRTDISKMLDSLGLGHVPATLPGNQNELVRLYNKGTQIGDLIETVLLPSVPNDKKLRARLDGKYGASAKQTERREMVEGYQERKAAGLCVRAGCKQKPQFRKNGTLRSYCLFHAEGNRKNCDRYLQRKNQPKPIALAARV